MLRCFSQWPSGSQPPREIQNRGCSFGHLVRRRLELDLFFRMTRRDFGQRQGLRVRDSDSVPSQAVQRDFPNEIRSKGGVYQRWRWSSIQKLLWMAAICRHVPACLSTPPSRELERMYTPGRRIVDPDQILSLASMAKSP